MIASAEPTDGVTNTGAPALEWRGSDDRGVMLHVIGVLLAGGEVLIIHGRPQDR